MKNSVFLDTGIFIAFLNRNDQWHTAAKSLFSVEKPKWTTSYLVISEAYSFTLHRYGEEPARSFRKFIENLAGLKIFNTTHEHHRQILKMLDKLRGSKLTYVDASSLCLIEQHKIKTVWSTDHHLGLTGVQVLPRP